MVKYKLTVSVPTYNQENYIAQCLNGIVNQKTNFPFQVIVSDDCSTDNTRKILKEYQQKYPDIVKPIYRKKNLGPMDNFIETLNGIHTEYVALCDGDDFWTDDTKLQQQVDFLDKNKDFNICFHQATIFWQNESKEEEIFPLNLDKTVFTFDDISKDNPIVTNTIVYRWKFRKENSFKEIFPKDIIPGDFFVHLYHIHNSKAKLIEKPMSKYRRHEAGMWWLTSQPGKQDEFFLKYGYKYYNFYKAVDKEFNLDEDYFGDIKKWIYYGSLDAYKRNKQMDLYNKMLEENPVMSKKYKKQTKLLYLFFKDRHRLFSIIKYRMAKKPYLNKIYEIIVNNLLLIIMFLSCIVNIISFLILNLSITNYMIASIISTIISIIFETIAIKLSCSRRLILRKNRYLINNSFILLTDILINIIFSVFNQNFIRKSFTSCIIMIINYISTKKYVLKVKI